MNMTKEIAIPGPPLETTSSACNISDTVIATNSTNLAVEERPSEETGCSKWKHILRQMPTLNGFLCGIVVDSQSDRVLKCRRLGCETQWVKICSEQEKLQATHLYSSITYIAFHWKLFHKIGFARPVRHLGQVEGQRDHDDDVILPYLDMCLIM